MLEKQEFKGVWMLPDSDQQINGTLSFGPDQPIRLELLSGAGQDIIRLLPDRENIVLWGYTTQGEDITLFNCNQLSCAFPGIGLQTAVYNAEYILLGAHLKAMDLPVFKNARISISGLDEWFGINGYALKEGFDMKTFEITYLKPEDIQVDLDAGTSLKFSSWINYPHINTNETILRQQHVIDLEFDQMLTLNQVISKTWKIQRFFGFLTQTNLPLRWYHLKSPLFKNVFSKPGGAVEFERNITLFFRQNATGKEGINPRSNFLRFEAVKYKMEEAMKMYFELEGKLGPIIDILYANLGESKQYLQNIFLNLVQAVEAYHRITLQDTEKLRDENREKLDRLFSYLPEGEDRSWLEQKLAYSYEPGLRKRLKELFELNKTLLFHKPLPINKKVNKLIEEIVNKRNYLTHLDGSTNLPVLEPYTLLRYNMLLKQLLTLLLLRSLGFDEDFLSVVIPLRSKFRLAD